MGLVGENLQGAIGLIGIWVKDKHWAGRTGIGVMKTGGHSVGGVSTDGLVYFKKRRRLRINSQAQRCQNLFLNVLLHYLELRRKKRGNAFSAIIYIHFFTSDSHLYS